MLKPTLILVFCLVAIPSFAEKADPLAGNWTCQAHGSAQGELAFRLALTQSKDSIDGSISSSSTAIGSTQISSGTIRRHMVEIHFDTPGGNYVLMGRYSKGHISGTWSNDTEKGPWEADRQDAKPKRHRHL